MRLAIFQISYMKNCLVELPLNEVDGVMGLTINIK
jgi:hypothetical protein